MKVIYNDYIPFGSFIAMTIGPFIFTKRDVLTPATIQHEEIHWKQQKETFILPFFILYGLMFVYEYIRCLFNSNRGYVSRKRNTVFKRAYRNIAFEREAYRNEETQFYVKYRRHYAWLRKYSV